MPVCAFCGVDPESSSTETGLPRGAFWSHLGEGEVRVRVGDHPRGHDCFCVRDKEVLVTKSGKKTKLLRVAWGICCARTTVGVDLMAEEDFHDGCPWSEPSDCTCGEEEEKAT